MADIQQMKAGQPVAEFLGQLDNNFSALNSDLDTKQPKVYVMSVGSSSGNIIISADGVPSGGRSGDIVIIYER